MPSHRRNRGRNKRGNNRGGRGGNRGAHASHSDDHPTPPPDNDNEMSDGEVEDPPAATSPTTPKRVQPTLIQPHEGSSRKRRNRDRSSPNTTSQRPSPTLANLFTLPPSSTPDRLTPKRIRRKHSLCHPKHNPNSPPSTSCKNCLAAFEANARLRDGLLKALEGSWGVFMRWADDVGVGDGSTVDEMEWQCESERVVVERTVEVERYRGSPTVSYGELMQQEVLLGSMGGQTGEWNSQAQSAQSAQAAPAAPATVQNYQLRPQQQGQTVAPCDRGGMRGGRRTSDVVRGPPRQMQQRREYGVYQPAQQYQQQEEGPRYVVPETTAPAAQNSIQVAQQTSAPTVTRRIQPVLIQPHEVQNSLMGYRPPAVHNPESDGGI